MNQTESPDDLYFKALELQMQADFIGAFELLAQENAEVDAAAQSAGGIAYDSGLGAEETKEKAISWFKKAWRSGKQTSHCMSTALNCVEVGQYRRAMYWWQKAIILGDGSAALSLAKFLLETNNPRVYNRVLDLLKRAANSQQEHGQISAHEKAEAIELLNHLDAHQPIGPDNLLPAA